MRATLLTAVLFAFWLPACMRAHNSLTDEDLLRIKFDQHLGAQVQTSLAFRDDTGKAVRFGDYFGARPMVLVLGYYRCPMLCSLVLNGMTESLRDLKWSAGRDFDVLFVGIDPGETPALAAEKKANYLRDYGRPGSASGWHFLTGTAEPIRTLADEIGFRYAYDPATKQFAHPSGFVILTPQGTVSRYFFGVTFAPSQVDTALREAAARKIGSPVQELILLCCQYDPFRGKYGSLAMNLVRTGGIGMTLLLGAYFARPLWRKPQTRK